MEDKNIMQQWKICDGFKIPGSHPWVEKGNLTINETIELQMSQQAQEEVKDKVRCRTKKKEIFGSQGRNTICWVQVILLTISMDVYSYFVAKKIDE